jgi:mRNA-degrading endonuclease RelE of RelBE toxin-antitoxin system
MNRSFQNYNPRYTPFFEKQLKKLGDKMRVKRIKETAEAIVEDPYHNVEFGVGKFRGKREERAWRGDRIIFTVCEQCKKLKHQEFNPCASCDDVPENTITFWEIIDDHDYTKGGRVF